MKTADPELMRAINRFHVLDTIRRAGSTSRTEIGAATELSSTTVSAITAALLDEGLIIPRAIGDIRATQRGRPRVMLELNPDAARVIGVRLAPQRVVCALTDFQGDVLADRTALMPASSQPADAVAERIEALVRGCLADADLVLGEIKSLCVALPGVTEHSTGIVRHSPLLCERNIPLGPLIGARLGLPVLVESDSNAAAVAEHWFRHCRCMDDFLVVVIGDPLGLAVMHDGQLFRGARGLSLHLSDRIGGSVDSLGAVIANLITLFAPPRVMLANPALAPGERLLAPLRAVVAATLPAWLADVVELAVDDIDDIGWARGAAGAALRQLYGAPWGGSGPFGGPLPPQTDDPGA